METKFLSNNIYFVIQNFCTLTGILIFAFEHIYRNTFPTYTINNISMSGDIIFYLSQYMDLIYCHLREITMCKIGIK